MVVGTVYNLHVRITNSYILLIHPVSDKGSKFTTVFATR